MLIPFQTFSLEATTKAGERRLHASHLPREKTFLTLQIDRFSPTVQLQIERLRTAKRDLRLPQELAKLDHVACLVLDDIGYVQKDRDEMEVLFTLLAERYERRSVILTTNLIFSEWNRIFKDPMTTMAAIDRVVHHSVILDFMTLESYRAKQVQEQQESSPPETVVALETAEKGATS